MIDYLAPLYQHPQEIWDKETCIKMSKRLKRDGLGTPYPQRGYLEIPSQHGYGETQYNGGCVRDGKWYQGENFPLPQIHEDFHIEQDSWEFRIFKKGKR